MAPIRPANETASLPTVRQDERRRRNIMQDSTVQSDLHSPHSSGDLAPITREPTGPPGSEPTGTLKDAPQVPLSVPHAQQRTFLPQRGLYYAAIAGVIAGVFTA